MNLRKLYGFGNFFKKILSNFPYLYVYNFDTRRSGLVFFPLHWTRSLFRLRSTHFYNSCRSSGVNGELPVVFHDYYNFETASYKIH